MTFLEENIKGLCEKFGIDYVGFLADLEVEHVFEMSLYDVQTIAEEYQLDVYSLLYKPVFRTSYLTAKLSAVKLLVLDVDGVMTDGGMYFTENGDQIKKYNTKDGMAIIGLTKKNFQVAIISSGFAPKMVEARATMLGIQNCIVTREPKIDILKKIANDLNISMENIAMIGDDINDLDVMHRIGIAACPSDAVQSIKNSSHIILQKKGGEGCVREFIDTYLHIA